MTTSEATFTALLLVAWLIVCVMLPMWIRRNQKRYEDWVADKTEGFMNRWRR